jgi:hypothetical protein
MLAALVVAAAGGRSLRLSGDARMSDLPLRLMNWAFVNGSTAILNWRCLSLDCSNTSLDLVVCSASGLGSCGPDDSSSVSAGEQSPAALAFSGESFDQIDIQSDFDLPLPFHYEIELTNPDGFLIASIEVASFCMSLIFAIILATWFLIVWIQSRREIYFEWLAIVPIAIYFTFQVADAVMIGFRPFSIPRTGSVFYASLAIGASLDVVVFAALVIRFIRLFRSRSTCAKLIAVALALGLAGCSVLSEVGLAFDSVLVVVPAAVGFAVLIAGLTAILCLLLRVSLQPRGDWLGMCYIIGWIVPLAVIRQIMNVIIVAANLFDMAAFTARELVWYCVRACLLGFIVKSAEAPPISAKTITSQSAAPAPEHAQFVEYTARQDGDERHSTSAA